MNTMRFVVPVVCTSLLVFGACKPQNRSKDSLKTSYFHKYGAELATEKDWRERGACGEIHKKLITGVLVREQYQNGMLHGTKSWSFPHRDTVERVAHYTNGTLQQETRHYLSGAPREKRAYNEHGYIEITSWYEDATPRAVEQYQGLKLVKGDYFSPTNEKESTLANGTGIRPVRDGLGQLLARETIADGVVVMEETYYANGTPQAQVPYVKGRIEGQKKTFFANGAPSTVEEFKDGVLHGKVKVFSNGELVAEIAYQYGKKDGIEKRFKAGTDVVEQEITWVNDRRHGPTNFYVEGGQRTEWYLAGDKVRTIADM